MRRLYTVLSWGREDGKGYATDGTAWEGSPILYAIYSKDLDTSYNGFLIPEEQITARESAFTNNDEITLYDILVESGPRSIQPAPPAAAAIWAFDPNPPVDAAPRTTHYMNLSSEEWIKLIRRVESLEHQVFGGEQE